MNRPPLELAIAVAALLVASAVPSMGQQFEYTPYKGFNNTGQPAAPPPDDYTPTHQGGGASPDTAYSNGAAAPGYQAETRRDTSSDAYDNESRAPAPSRNAYPRSGGGGGTYSPSEDVYSPSRGGDAAPPPLPPPHGVGGPPARDGYGELPSVQVQAVAPDDGVPFEVRERDARRAAIEGWRSKVADRFGPEFSHWRVAIGKRVDCHPDRRDGLVCVASAQPARGFGGSGDGPRDDRD